MNAQLLHTIADEMASKHSAAQQPDETIGERIRRYRKAKGQTQTELGKLVGLSQRLMTYYETQGGSPSTDLLVAFSKALGVPLNVLMGVEPEKKRAAAPTVAPESVRLWRRFQLLEELPEHDRKTVLKMIDALAERSRRRRAG